MSTNLLPADINLLEHSLTALGYDAIAKVIPVILAEVNEKTSGCVYKQDIKAFIHWLHEAEINLQRIEKLS